MKQNVVICYIFSDVESLACHFVAVAVQILQLDYVVYDAYELVIRKLVFKQVYEVCFCVYVFVYDFIRKLVDERAEEFRHIQDLLSNVMKRDFDILSWHTACRRQIVQLYLYGLRLNGTEIHIFVVLKRFCRRLPVRLFYYLHYRHNKLLEPLNIEVLRVRRHDAQKLFCTGTILFFHAVYLLQNAGKLLIYVIFVWLK